jgi:hypothetical protein
MAREQKQEKEFNAPLEEAAKKIQAYKRFIRMMKYFTKDNLLTTISNFLMRPLIY